MSNCIAFDLGGTLTKLEQTCDLLQLTPDGMKISEIIGRYDEILFKAKTPGYEEGDAPIRLFIVLFLLNGVTEADITRVASERTLAPGALDLVAGLLTDGWRIFCITNTYEPYAIHITHKFGIYAHNIASTPLPLDLLRASLTEKDISLFKTLKENILALNSADETRIKKTLDLFFEKDLPITTIGKSILQTWPVSGSRKTEALKRFSEKYQEPLSKWVVLGNSFADTHMLAEVDHKGGLAIAFNADLQALSQATMSLASTHLIDLKDVLAAWKRGQRRETKWIVQEKERRKGTGDRANFHWLAERDRNKLDDIMKIHQQIRQILEQSTQKPG
jgi:predicted HAD superfamily phosphohydrolase